MDIEPIPPPKPNPYQSPLPVVRERWQVRRKRRKRRPNWTLEVIKVIMGGLAGTIAGWWFIHYVTGRDFGNVLPMLRHLNLI